MRLKQKEMARHAAYNEDSSVDTLGNLHERMRAVRTLAQKYWETLSNDEGRRDYNNLYQAIWDLETEVSFYEAANPPYGRRETPARRS